jgi:Lar family restriction alleviation protein
MSDELKPCPFCGSENVSVATGSRKSPDPDEPETWFQYVECEACECAGPFADDNERRAIAVWNTRTP